MGPQLTLGRLGFSSLGIPQPAADDKVQKFLTTWDAIELAVGLAAPKTVQSWVDKTAAALAAAQGLPPAPRLQGAYLLPWSIRALLRDRMQSEGIQQLKIDQTPVGAYIQMCPDMSHGLYKAWQYFIQCQGVKAMTVREFINQCGGKAPELLSMWILSCSQVITVVRWHFSYQVTHVFINGFRNQVTH